jgi:hypothetical protein
MTREPHQPTFAVVVEGTYHDGTVDDLQLTIPYAIRLDRVGPGAIEFTLTINNKICGQLPFDNLVKAATRIDPDNAVGPEKQIQKLRKETAEARAEMYDWQAKALQLEERLKQYEAAEAVPNAD